MKLLSLGCLAAMLLVAPAAAHAGVPVVAPIGASVCATDGTCMTLESTDKIEEQSYAPSNMSLPFDVANGLVKRGSIYQWGSAGCSLVGTPVAPGGDCTLIPGVKVGWRVRRFHQYRKTEEYFDALVFRFYPATDTDLVQLGSVPDSLTHRPQFNTPDCNASGDNDGWIVPWISGPSGLAAGPLAPDDFAQACGLPRAGSTTTDGDADEADPPAPAACAPITYGRKRVTITSTGFACPSARNVAARFLTRKLTPRGWRCVTTRVGVRRTTTCGKAEGRGIAEAPRLVARWRV